MDLIERLSPDLLVLDANMPDFEPISAVRQLKAARPLMKILIVSAHDNENYVVGLLNPGADGYHMKDQPLADLQLAIQRILGGERWISSSLVGKLAHQHAAPASSAMIWLTRRQRELLRLLTQGLDNRNIAQMLELSVKTVENHLTALYRVLGVDSRLKADHYALRHPELLAISGQETLELEPLQQKNEHDLVILVVDVSAYPDRGFRKHALSAGAVAFVDKKDLDTASLRQVIKDALR
jgi:DNA-binding NarL/FixJ family response regulator